MKTSATNRRIRTLMTAIRDEKLVPRPEFQRRLVWTNRHKENFLKTVLLKYPFPEIYVASGEVDPDSGEGTEMLVDGQQRITTLYQYFRNSEDLQLKDIRPYSELPRKEKLAFLEYEVVIRDLGSKSIEEIREVFQRINSTKYSLNAMEIHNSRFDGALKKYAEEMSQHDFFSDNYVFRTNDIRRMGDLTFCLTIIITVMSGYFHRDDLLEDFLRSYNEEFHYSEDLTPSLNQVFKFIERCGFEPKSRVWRKADLLTLIVEVYNSLVHTRGALEVSRVSRALKNFYSSVDAVRQDETTADEKAATYYKAALQATNDRVNRVRRGDIISNIIEEQ